MLFLTTVARQTRGIPRLGKISTLPGRAWPPQRASSPGQGSTRVARGLRVTRARDPKGQCDCAITACRFRRMRRVLRQSRLARLRRRESPPDRSENDPPSGAASAEFLAEMQALSRAKRTLAEEKRYFCWVRGSCGQCAHEADCPCGSDLATWKGKGVCGECFGGWHAGHGSFDGIQPSDVVIAAMPGVAGSMSPLAGRDSG
jgi:hypothetical protein